MEICRDKNRRTSARTAIRSRVAALLRMVKLSKNRNYYIRAFSIANSGDQIKKRLGPGQRILAPAFRESHGPMEAAG
jgi:hypothetical protein